MHSPPTYIEIAQRYADAWNAHDLTAIMALHSDDTHYELHGRSQPAVGTADVRARFAAELAGVPDIRFDLVSLHGGLDHVVFRSRVTGTIEDRPVEFDAIDLLTLRDGLVRCKHTYLVTAP